MRHFLGGALVGLMLGFLGTLALVRPAVVPVSYEKCLSDCEGQLWVWAPERCECAPEGL